MTQTPAKLYQYTACPFCWKVKAMLYHCQVPFTEIEVEPMKKKELAFSSDYKKVPIFVDSDGTVVVDSTEIMRYIDKKYAQKKYAQRSLFSGSNRETTLLDLSEKIAFALPPVIYRSLLDSWRAFSYISKVSSFPFWQKGFIRLFGSIVMYIVAKKKAKSKGITNPEEHLRSLLQALTPMISSEEEIGAGDYAVWGILRSVQQLPCFEEIEHLPAVRHWYERVAKSFPPC